MFSSKVTFLFLFLIVFSGILTAQPNSVRLTDENGSVISLHSSITSAYNAIPAQISQAYIIELLADYNTVSESFPIQITPRTGSSADNTITLRPASGNNNAVISRALNNNPIINLNGVKFFILDGRPGGFGEVSALTIENTLNVGAKTNTINFIDGASNNVVKYVVAKSVPRSNAGPRNIYFSSSNSAAPTNNNIIENCEIIGGRSGVGFSGNSSGINSGNIIKDTKIINFGYAAVWLVSAAENTKIENCTIYQEESGLNTSMVAGIILSEGAARGTTELLNNKIYSLRHNSTAVDAKVIGIIGSGTNGSTLNIVNNFIAITDDNFNTSFTHGIYLTDSTEFTCNVFYNSVRIGGVQTGGAEGEVVSSGITKNNLNPNASFNIFNNLFMNSRLGQGYNVGGNYANTEGQLNINYNSYHTESIEAVYHAIWGTTLGQGISDYKAAAFPNEQNTIFKGVEFVSETDLHLTGNSIGDFDLVALPLEGISFDIDYNVRHSEYPYKGAAEAEALPVELSSFTSSVTGNDVTLTWITKTEINNSGFEIQRKSTSGSWKTIKFIDGAGTVTEEQIYFYTDNQLAAGTYNYRLKQIDFGGISTYYNLSETIEILNPVEFSLGQNYPNPFNPSTKISYTVPVDGFVTLTIYNSLGEEVVTLVNNMVKAGNHEVSFNASSLSSGTYIYRLNTADFSSTKKMVLIK
jgi:hypothetical protein